MLKSWNIQHLLKIYNPSNIKRFYQIYLKTIFFDNYFNQQSRITMGNNSIQISYQCGSKYEGQVVSNLPHGKGTLRITKNSPSYNPKLLLNDTQQCLIKTQFFEGVVKQCVIETRSGFRFQSSINQKQQFTGHATLTDSLKTQYSGTFQNGKLTNGRVQSLNNQSQPRYICQGQYVGTSILNNVGTYYNITDRYLVSGEFHKGKIQKGIYIFSNGDFYQGEFSQGCPTGQGTYLTKTGWMGKTKIQPDMIQDNKMAQQLIQTFDNKENVPAIIDGFEYKGDFKNKNPQGKGQVTFQNGHKYKGKFKDCQMHGFGQYTYPDGTVYKGGFYFGSMNGDATIDYTQTSLINQNKQPHEILQKYEGQISEGIFHGLGILYYANGVIFKGYFLEGAKNGPAVLIYCEKKFKCLYVMNKLAGGLKEIIDR